MDLRVKIGKEAESSRDLFDVPWDTDLESVIAMFRRWGVNDEFGDRLNEENMYGQFVVSSTEDPFFEVVIGTTV